MSNAPRLQFDIGRAVGPPNDGLSLSAFVDMHPDAEAPRLYAVGYSIGGCGGDYMSKDDLLRVLAVWQKMLTELPA